MANSLKTALIANFLIAVMKFTMGAISGSKTMLAEGAHSLADTMNQILLWFGIRRSKKAADEEHHFGYSKVQFFWAFVVAILIFGIGGTYAFYEGLIILLDPTLHELHPEQTIWNILVIAVAMVLEAFAFRTAYKEAKHFKEETGQETIIDALEEMQDPVLNTVLMEDSLALLGLLIALAGLIVTRVTGEPVVDGITSMLIGIVLIFGGLFLARENKQFLIGKAVSETITNKIIEITMSFTEVQKIKNLSTMLLGPKDMIVALDVKFFDEYETDQIGELIDAIENAIGKEIDIDKSKIFIEAQ